MSAKNRPVTDDETLAGLPPIGPELRARREQFGIELLQAATVLRIKPAYLNALEDGRYRDLPGAAYAIGFVRTYGDYLGMDGQEVVRRFKHEAAGGLNQRTTLAFPSAAPRGRVPGTVPLLIGLLAAAAIAGAWYLWREEARGWLGQIPDVPDRLMASAGSTPETVPHPPTVPQTAPAVQTAAATPAPAQTVISVPPPPPPAAASAPAPAPSASAQSGTQSGTQPGTGLTAVPTVGQTVALPAAPAHTPASVQPPPSPPQPAQQDSARRLAPIPPPPQPQPAQADAGGEDETPPPPTETGSETASATPATAAPAPAPVNTEGRTFGAVNEQVRVVIRSKGDSWVQVRDAENQAIMTRMLRPGDIYRVPNKPGLMLMTGNAGVLEVQVDGQAAPALGPVGMVRRSVPLDPDRLKAGTLE
jgi:cytoskeleton protein RodZ